MLKSLTGRVSVLTAAAFKGVGGFEHQLKSGRYTRKLGNHTTMWYPNGVRERTRRMRQIACGQLTASNGLVRGPAFPKVNSHGKRA